VRWFESETISETEVGYGTKKASGAYHIDIEECKNLTGILDWGHVVEMRSPGKGERRIWRERDNRRT
jgi:hypothetical protein